MTVIKICHLRDKFEREKFPGESNNKKVSLGLAEEVTSTKDLL